VSVDIGVELALSPAQGPFQFHDLIVIEFHGVPT
jgi:hypothetical protein